MSATWKMTGKGGTAKVKEFFCHCCDTTSDEIAHHNEKIVNSAPISWKIITNGEQAGNVITSNL